MLRFDSHLTNDEGYTYALTVNGKNILTKWGIEFSDSEGFFIHGQHGNAPMEILTLERSATHTHVEMNVHLRTTRMRIVLDESFSPQKITRTYTLSPSAPTFMQDISVSQGFKQDAFSHLHIAGKKIGFSGVERNHQFPISEVTLAGKEFDLHIQLESQHAGTGFERTFYGRMSPKNGWVVHARLFPKEIARKAIVWCNPLWNKKIPFSDFLVHITPLTNYLWNVGEDPLREDVRTFGFNAFGLARVGAKDIVLKETITLVPHAKTKRQRQK